MGDKMKSCDVNQGLRKSLFWSGLGLIVISSYFLFTLYQSGSGDLVWPIVLFFAILLGDIMCMWEVMCSFKTSWFAKASIALFTVPFLFWVVIFVNANIK